MSPIEVLVPIMGIMIVLVPVTGVTLILAARYALRPILRELAETRMVEPRVSPQLQAQMEQMAEEIDTLQAEVHRLKELNDFDRRLLRSDSTKAS